jgi:endogenous inhibitor of DNA gyrase (YacG/DUF329 family)
MLNEICPYCAYRPDKRGSMKVTCPECQKVFEIPQERLKKYDKQIAFPCPACQKGQIKIELESTSAQPSPEPTISVAQ